MKLVASLSVFVMRWVYFSGEWEITLNVKCRVKIVKYWLFRDSFLGPHWLTEEREHYKECKQHFICIYIWNNNNFTWSRRGPGLIWPRQVSVSFWEMETRLLQTWLSVSGLHSKPEYNSRLIYQLYKIERNIHCTDIHGSHQKGRRFGARYKNLWGLCLWVRSTTLCHQVSGLVMCVWWHDVCMAQKTNLLSQVSTLSAVSVCPSMRRFNSSENIKMQVPDIFLVRMQLLTIAGWCDGAVKCNFLMQKN